MGIDAARRRVLLTAVILSSLAIFLALLLFLLQSRTTELSDELPTGGRTSQATNSDTLVSMSSGDPRLREWMVVRLQKSPASTVSSADMLANLRATLSSTSLRATDLFAIAEAFHTVSKDPRASEVIYRTAASHAESELLAANGSSTRTLPILQAMQAHMQDYKNVLWPLIESGDDQHTEALNTLFCIYSDMVRHYVPGDATVTRSMTHVKIGLSECFMLKGQTSDAVGILEKLSPAGMKQGERNAFDWGFGLALYRSGRYAEAIVHFKSVIDQPDYKYSANALPPLIDSLCNLGRGHEAEGYYDAFVRRYRPNLPMQLQYKSEIDQATFQEDQIAAGMKRN